MRAARALALASALAAAPLAPAGAQTAGSVRVTATRANVRAEPNEKAAVVSQVTAGTVLELKGVEGDWYRVQLPPMGSIRVEAFLSKKVATLVGPASVPTGASGAKSATTAAAPVPPAVMTPTSRDGMSVAVQEGGASGWLTPGSADLSRTAERGASLRAIAAVMPLGQPVAPPPAGSGQMTYVWTVSDAVSPRVLTESRPGFVVQFKDVPGVSPDDFSPAIVQLVTTPGGSRIVAAVRGRADQASRLALDWDVTRELKQEAVRTSVELVERGVVRIQPAAALAPGHYAVVLRPNGSKKFSGASVLSPTAEGRVFGVVWAFTVK
jgi:SH3 domain-containing protein